jgi:SAM-dependent methyltransferase
MVTSDQSIRALSFGAVAEDCDRFRPGPPSEALTWLLPVPSRTAVDIGAGTGAFTRLLVSHSERVIAVEPDTRMGAVLAERVPTASTVSARAEELPFGDTCVDAIVGSSMWHWVDEEEAVFEAARVLRPGGVLGLLWSGWDRSEPWLAGLLLQAGAARFRDDEKARDHRHDVHLPAGSPFTEGETYSFRWTLTVTPEHFVGLIGTYSRFIALPAAERTRRRDAMTDVVGAHLALTNESEIRLSMRCTCWRAVRQA